jgi:hypothetical protein
MRTSCLLLIGVFSALLTGCGDEMPPEASKKSCPNLDRSMLEGERVADSCFQLNPDAFSFQNYTDGANLRVEEMIEVFGNGVCRSDNAACSDEMQAHGQCNADCVLTNKSLIHMRKYNEWIKAGRCDGMAAMSQLLYSGTIENPKGTSTFALERDKNLEHEIARWWTTQVTVQQRGSGVYEDKETSEAAGYLDYLWSHGSGATLWVYYLKNQKTAAHAVTPYAITSPTEGMQRIYVYDSNAPETLKYVELNLTSGKWTYDLDPGATEKVQAGTDMSPPRLNKLRFVSNQARVGRYCWFCENTFANVSQNLVTLSRDVTARVFDKTKDLAQKTEQGSWTVDNDVELHFPLANLDDTPLPSLIFEPTEPYEIEFDSAADAEQGELTVSVPGNVTMGVYGIQNAPGKSGIIGTATVDPAMAAQEIKYQANDAAKVTLHWAALREDANQSLVDHAFRVTMKSPAAGLVSLRDDETTGEVKIGFETTDPNYSAYELEFEIVRTDASGFVKTDEFSWAPEAQKVAYGITTNVMNDSIDVKIDVNADGSIEMTQNRMPTMLDLTMGPYTLKTDFLGEYICLEGNDPLSASHSGNAFMEICGPATGQLWQFIPIGGTPFSQLQTQFLGTTKCLDGFAVDMNNEPLHGGATFMNDCNPSAPGQQWSVVKSQSGHYILQAPLVNPDLCLEGNAPDSPVQYGSAFLDGCQDVSGQRWVLAP